MTAALTLDLPLPALSAFPERPRPQPDPTERAVTVRVVHLVPDRFCRRDKGVVLVSPAGLDKLMQRFPVARQYGSTEAPNLGHRYTLIWRRM